MATVKDLFKSRQKQIYGNDNIRIESRGLINPPRGAALLMSSPNAIADLIGNQIGGALKGSANRPSDTIFKGKGVFNKPISLFKTQEGLRRAIEPGTDYFIKQSPAPESILAKLTQGASNLGDTATSLAINAVTKGGLKKLRESLKKPKGKGFITLSDGTMMPEYNNKKTYYDTIDIKEEIDFNRIQQVESIKSEDLEKTLQKYYDSNQVLVLFKKYGKSTVIPFEGTISGLSEDISPEWTNFRYIGSPFKVNRYQGVERSLKFNLKLYYIGPVERNIMLKKIHYLKSLAFPYDEISEMKYGNDTQSSQYAFSPNLINVAVGDMYPNVFGFIENLSFSVDENTTWPNYFGDIGEGKLMYPSTIDVSIGIKIIETPTTETKGGVTKYKYDFDGGGYRDAIDEIVQSEKEAKSDIQKWTEDRSID